MDPESEASSMQAQNNAFSTKDNVEEEDSIKQVTAVVKKAQVGGYQSLYANGFTAFDQIQKDVVDDVISDEDTNAIVD